MRFARPAAAGLGVGVLAGFAVALVRPRSPASPTGPAAAPAPGTTGARRPPARPTVDATATDAPADTDSGSDFPGRVI
jgi:hypothetical protein